MVDKVVKIDSELLEKVEAFINKKENKFRYVNRKQFIDIAVSEFLLSKGISLTRQKEVKNGKL
jgi:hypothetical protein